MVEIKIGVLRGQCLDRRIGERNRLIREIDAWQTKRNASGARITWKFTTKRPATSSPAPTQSSRKSRNHCDEVLGYAKLRQLHRKRRLAGDDGLGTTRDQGACCGSFRVRGFERHIAVLLRFGILLHVRTGSGVARP
jgi:hypothetical protein